MYIPLHCNVSRISRRMTHYGDFYHRSTYKASSIYHPRREEHNTIREEMRFSPYCHFPIREAIIYFCLVSKVIMG
jgi:hypothetical protein